MTGKVWLPLLFAPWMANGAVPAAPADIGATAIEWTREITDLGPRPPGSEGIRKVRAWIESKVSSFQLKLERDSFTAATPVGSIEMQNLHYIVPGKNGTRRVILMAHYDSAKLPGITFVGANDAASSVALLLALTPEIVKRRLPYVTEVVFVDGEEAVKAWTEDDSLYGSRHVAAKLPSLKTIPVQASIVLDMIGDADLQLIHEPTCDRSLRDHLRQVLAELGEKDLLDTTPTEIVDDHRPLIAAGIPTLHLMDWTYGGNRSPGLYWHTPQDTVDRLSAKSLSRVGKIVLGLLDKMSAEKSAALLHGK